MKRPKALLMAARLPGLMAALLPALIAALLPVLMAALLPGLPSGPAWAQGTAEMRDLRRETRLQGEAAAEAQRLSETARSEERRMAEARVAAARSLHSAEARVAQADAAARTTNEAVRRAVAERAERAAALLPFLPLLHRLERWPAESLLAMPSAPEDTLRGLLAMQAVIRHAGAVSEAFRQAAERAEQARLAAEAELAALNAARADARAADARLEAALAQARARRADAQAQEDAAARRAREASARVTDLEQAMQRLERDRLERERREAEAARSAAAPRPPPPDSPRGAHAMPVAGQVAREFGAAGEGGPARGMTLLAGPRARVTAPCAGRVAYAGAFRSYGQLVIIDCGAGTHLVLARMERLETATGERVLAGEPVGSLPAGEPRLYVELRRNGQPADPRGFFAGPG